MWKMFLPLWPLDNLRVLSHEETSPFLMKCALVLTFFLNDSLWNFPSNQCSKIKGSYFHLDPEAPTLSLRRRACKLERLYPYTVYQISCPTAVSLGCVFILFGCTYVRYLTQCSWGQIYVFPQNMLYFIFTCYPLFLDLFGKASTTAGTSIAQAQLLAHRV